MTEKQVRKLVRKWQKRLGLDGWKIEVKCLEAEVLLVNDTRGIALCHRDNDALTATLSFAMPEFREDCVIHELLHLATAPIGNVVEVLLQALGTEAQEMLGAQYARAEENLVYRLERVFGDVEA